jgi:type IV pilus assembly protein PilM
MLGLEISSTEIRLLQLAKVKNQWVVENYAWFPLPTGAILDGKIKQLDIIQAALSSIMERTRTKGYPIAIALPITSVISKRIKLAAYLHPQECEADISTNLHYYLPGTSDELCFDFALTATHEGYQEVLLVASRYEQLHAYVLLANNVGWKVKIVDVDLYALARASQLAFPSYLQTTAMVEVQQEITQFVLFHQKTMIFNQQWRTDSVMLTQQLKRMFHLLSSLHAAVLPVECLVVAGEAVNYADLEQALALPVWGAHPFQQMALAAHITKTELDEVASRFMVSCGLAMRSVPRW